jgi:DNA-binding transcriptional LysR family regulator
MDKLGGMEVFVAAVECGSLSAAARTLGRSLTAVSRQLAALEASLGAPLLVRTTRHLAMTEGGRVFYERAKQILGEIGEAELALSAETAVPSGRLHVSAPTLLGRARLAPLLPVFLARHPLVAIDLSLIDRNPRLAEEGIDVALRIGPLDDSSLIARKLGSIELVVCAAPDYLAQRGEPQRPGDLADHDCLVFGDAGSTAQWHFQTAAGRRSVTVPALLRANDLDAVVAAALGGAGLVRAPSWQIAHHVVAGRLQPVLTPYQRPSTPLHALFLPVRLASPRVRAFADFLVEQWGDPR